MEIRDITLTGGIWRNVKNCYLDRFFSTQWDIFKLATSIGILYDEQLDDADMGEDLEKEAKGAEPMNINRSMLIKNPSEITYFFQTAILTSSCTSLSNIDRLYLAFSEDISSDELEGDEEQELKKGVSEQALNFDKLDFLVRFANFGAKKLNEQIGKNPRATMERLTSFLGDSYQLNTPELIDKYSIHDLEE